MLPSSEHVGLVFIFYLFCRSFKACLSFRSAVIWSTNKVNNQKLKGKPNLYLNSYPTHQKENRSSAPQCTLAVLVHKKCQKWVRLVICQCPETLGWSTLIPKLEEFLSGLDVSLIVMQQRRNCTCKKKCT